VTASWPLTVNNKVYESGFSVQPERNVAEFKPEVGPAKARRRTSVATDLVTYPIEIVKEEWAVLLAFYRDDLADGALPFLFVDPLTGETAAYQFVDPPKLGNPRGPYFDVALQLRRLP
jgi:hypothetical protein